MRSGICACAIAILFIWGCGDGGGGDTWRHGATGTGRHLTAVAFVGDALGWAVGDEDTILATTDGGKTWSPQREPGSTASPRVLNCVEFVDESVGWAGGSLGALYVTSDGGANWRTQDTGVREGILDLHFLGRSEGWAVGGRGIILPVVIGKPGVGLRGHHQVTRIRMCEACCGQSLASQNFVDAFNAAQMFSDRRTDLFIPYVNVCQLMVGQCKCLRCAVIDQFACRVSDNLQPALLAQ